MRVSTGAGHVYLHTEGRCREILDWNFLRPFRPVGRFNRITWCVFLRDHSYHLWDAASRATDRALSNVDDYHGLTDVACLTMQHVVCRRQTYVQKLRILMRKDFWFVGSRLGDPYHARSSSTTSTSPWCSLAMTRLTGCPGPGAPCRFHVGKLCAY